MANAESAPNYPPGGSMRLSEKQPKGLPKDHVQIEHLNGKGKVTATTVGYLNDDMKKALGLLVKPAAKKKAA